MVNIIVTALFLVAAVLEVRAIAKETEAHTNKKIEELSDIVKDSIEVDTVLLQTTGKIVAAQSEYEKSHEKDLMNIQNAIDNLTKKIDSLDSLKKKGTKVEKR